MKSDGIIAVEARVSGTKAKRNGRGDGRFHAAAQNGRSDGRVHTTAG